MDALALAEELGARLGGMKGAGPKLMEFLSMVRFGPGQYTRPCDVVRITHFAPAASTASAYAPTSNTSTPHCQLV